MLGLSCDGASPNWRLWKLHGDSIRCDELIYKVLNLFADDGRDFCFIPDPPHLLKTIRNSFCNPKRNLWVRKYGVNTFSLKVDTWAYECMCVSF